MELWNFGILTIVNGSTNPEMSSVAVDTVMRIK